jgi:glycosyltransferase involved in cell wall biosynthesis
MRLSICIPTFGALDYTKMCLESISKNTDSEYEIVIVDDVSPDNTREFLDTLDCKKIYHEENQGISKTWNDLIDNSSGDYICIINSDILFTPHWDNPLIEALDRYEVASPYHTMNELPQDFPDGKDRVANILPVLGCCFMFKRELIDKIGHFPEELRLWYGDNWLGKKARCCQIHGSYVHHFISKSANKGLVPEFDLQINRDKASYDALKL